MRKVLGYYTYDPILIKTIYDKHPSSLQHMFFAHREHSLEDFMFISEVRGQGMGEVGATVESARTFPCISEMLD